MEMADRASWGEDRLDEDVENVTGVTALGWMLLDRVKWLWRKLPPRFPCGVTKP